MQSNVFWNGLPDRADLGNSVMVVFNTDSGYYEPVTKEMLRGFVFRSGQFYVPTGSLLSGEYVLSDLIDVSVYDGITFFGSVSGSQSSSFIIYAQYSLDGSAFYTDGSAFVTFSGAGEQENRCFSLDSDGSRFMRLKVGNLGPDLGKIYAVNSTGWYWGTK